MQKIMCIGDFVDLVPYIALNLLLSSNKHEYLMAFIQKLRTLYAGTCISTNKDICKFKQYLLSPNTQTLVHNFSYFGLTGRTAIDDCDLIIIVF